MNDKKEIDEWKSSTKTNARKPLSGMYLPNNTKETIVELPSSNTSNPTTPRTENSDDYSWHLRELNIHIDNNTIPAKIDDKSKEFLFIVMNNKIYNVFETLSEFTLTKSYNYNPDEEYLSVIQNNFISTKSDAYNTGELRSVGNIENNNNNTFIKLINYKVIVRCEVDKKIDIYIYKVNGKNIGIPTKYSTAGDLIIYNNGIISTQEIVVYNNKLNNIVNSEIEYRVYSKINDTLASNENILSKLRGQAGYIKPKLYEINAITKDNFDETLFNALYIKIYPFYLIHETEHKNHKTDTINEYIQLLNYIDYFYYYKYKYNEIDCELHKDYKVYGNGDYKLYKQKYSKNIQNAPFCMHIFDFIYLLAFVKNKIQRNTMLLKYCYLLVDHFIEGNKKLNLNSYQIDNIKPDVQTYIYINTNPNYNTSVKKNINNEIMVESVKFGPFNDIYTSKSTNFIGTIESKLLDKNCFVIHYKDNNNRLSGNNIVNCYISELNADILNDINVILSIKNKNPYYVPNITLDRIQKSCIDEYCSLTIGCFNSINIKNHLLKSSTFQNIVGNNDVYEYFNNKTIIFIGYVNTNIDIANITEFITFNEIKSKIYKKDIYIVNTDTDENKLNLVSNVYHMFKLNIKTFNEANINSINEHIKTRNINTKNTSIGVLDMLNYVLNLGSVNTTCESFTKTSGWESLVMK